MAILGCIADDFTGASDLASFFVAGGMKTILYNEIPNEDEKIADVDAAVVALKTRTQETGDAVAVSLRAIQWLAEQGCSHFYIKYCSTFDSTREGNIGPICDAVMEFLNVKYTILCPALPVNGRTVREGRIYIDGVPLEKTSMRFHPLTPMWDSDIAELMKPQSRYPAYKIRRSWDKRNNLENADHYYLIPDFETSDDARKIAEQFGRLTLLTGGSGLAAELAGFLLRESRKKDKLSGKSLILAGSCSENTRRQIAAYQMTGGESIQLLPETVLGKDWNPAVFWESVREKLCAGNVLVYSSSTPDKVREAQERYGDVSSCLEGIMAELAARAVGEGLSSLIVAGGETSGAVVKRLGFRRFLIGESVAPGVPVMTPDENRALRLVLKSGNFGQEDFFERAIRMTGRGYA